MTASDSRPLLGEAAVGAPTTVALPIGAKGHSQACPAEGSIGLNATTCAHGRATVGPAPGKLHRRISRLVAYLRKCVGGLSPSLPRCQTGPVHAAVSLMSAL